MKIKTQLRLFLITIITILILNLGVFSLSEFISKADSTAQKFFFTFITIVFFIIEICCILFVFHFSDIITKSIAFLQRATDKITDGELDLPLERRKNSRGENEITSLIENLDRMRLSLKDESEREKRFIMGISHDLRTPVAVIKGYSEAISDGIVSGEEEIKNTVNIIHSKTKHLENMINTLINFVKLENKNWKEKLILQPLEPVVNEFVTTSIQTGILFNKKITGSINLSKEVKVYFDKELFLRALENLFTNALRYTKDNDSIEIRVNENTNEITIEIEDSGIGIEKKDLQFIFDISFRGTNSRREEGFGIGLSVVKYIINTHKWTIDVKSEKNVGTTFIITIPKIDSKA